MNLLEGIPDVKYLTWDSKFFGVQTAQILSRQLDASKLSSTLNALWAVGVELVYWASDPSDPDSSNGASVCSGLLVDTKIVYSANVDTFSNQIPSTCVIGEYNTLSGSDKDMEQIAIDCGEFSRFRVDPRISNEFCSELYRTWIRNSINRSFADNVLVANSQGVISGLVTVIVDSVTGSIGLLGVGKNYRGQGIGRALVSAAMGWFSSHDCSKATVVTQGRNHPARGLYESCGFSLEQTDDYYHFWNPAHDSV